METKRDGRQYSLITRRSVAIIKELQVQSKYTIQEIAEIIYKKKLPEFYLQRFKRVMSLDRIRDYVRYLRDLEILQEQGNNTYILNFKHRQRDEEWAQALSDQALLLLSKIFSKLPAEVPSFLESQQQKLYRKGHIPTIDSLLKEIGIERGRRYEITRWSLYMFTDGPSCRFDIRRYPVLLKREPRGGNI